MEQLDLLQAAGTDLRPASLDSLELTMDLGDLAIAGKTEETFDDLIAGEQYRKGNLPPLQACRRALRPGGVLTLTNPHHPADLEPYLDLQQMLLNAAGFVGVTVKSRQPIVVQATVRPPVAEEYEHGMVLREIIDPVEILACHEFARELYYYKDFNYDLDVVRQFDAHAAMGAVYDHAGRTIAVGRVVLRVPGHNCPFMYAIEDDGAHYEVPARFRRICEVMGLFKEGHSGVIAFKRLLEYLTQYAYYIAGVDSIWTTYDANDPFTGSYYKSKLLMREAGVRLTYRDFGGKWNLIWTDRIQELRDLHRDMFRR